MSNTHTSSCILLISIICPIVQMKIVIFINNMNIFQTAISQEQVVSLLFNLYNFGVL